MIDNGQFLKSHPLENKERAITFSTKKEKASHESTSLDITPARLSGSEQAATSGATPGLIRPLAGGGTPSVSFEGLGDPDIHSAQPYEGTWNADFGPDGPSATDSLIITVTRPGYLPFTCPVITDQAVAIVIEGVDYGTILLASDGTFTYTPTY